MNLTYAGIKLSICHFSAFEQRSLGSEDAADYERTHYFIDVTAVVNALATASAQGQPNNPAPGVAGDIPPVTIATLRHLLMQKRQLLTVDIGGTILLQAPQTFLANGNVVPGSVDANNGPNPISFDVIQFQGIRTFVVRYKIECWLNENKTPPSVIISNRWEQSEDIDRSFRSTLHTEGIVTFRPDLLTIFAKRADAFRESFILPVPNGYQRTNLRVRAASEGTHVAYSFDDEQPEGNYQLKSNSPIVEVRGKTWHHTHWPLPDFGRLPLPSGEMGVSVEVWGRNNSLRSQLANAVVKCITSAKTIGGAGFIISNRLGKSARIEVDFPRRRAYGELIFMVNGIIGGSLDAFFGKTIEDAANSGLVKDFNVDSLWVQGVGPQPIVGPAFKGTRSDAAIALITQILLPPDTAPPNTPGSPYIW